MRGEASISDNYAIPGRESRKDLLSNDLYQFLFSYTAEYTNYRRKLGIKTIIEECPRWKSIMFRSTLNSG